MVEYRWCTISDGSGFRILDEGLRVVGSGLKVYHLGARVWGSGLRVEGEGLSGLVSGFRAQGVGCGSPFWSVSLRQAPCCSWLSRSSALSAFRIWVSGSRVRVQG